MTGAPAVGKHIEVADGLRVAGIELRDGGTGYCVEVLHGRTWQADTRRPFPLFSEALARAEYLAARPAPEGRPEAPHRREKPGEGGSYAEQGLLGRDPVIRRGEWRGGLAARINAAHARLDMEWGDARSLAGRVRRAKARNRAARAALRGGVA